MSLAEQTLVALRDRGWMVTTAESCTGGLVIGALTDIAGSSDVVDRGFITYSNDAKRAMLGVMQATLDEFGAVSEPVARQMAQGALASANAQIAIAITGVAGPGASENKPEGMVWFGLSTSSGTQTQEMQFGAIGRKNVRKASVDHALNMILAACNLPD